MRAAKYLTLALAAALSALGTQASAATVVSACNPNQVSPDAVACAGWFDGNLLNASHIQDQKDALASIGLNWDGNWAAVDLTKVNAVGSTFDFTGLLNGDVWIGIHKGKGGRTGFEGTGFFKLSAVNLDAVVLDLNGASSAVVYNNNAPAVPEPATWAMMLIGFAGVGAAMRRDRRRIEAPQPA